MTAAFDAIRRYTDAGLADDAQAGVLQSMLRSDGAARVINAATERGTPLSLAEFEAGADTPAQVNNRMRYIIMFGAMDGRINSFAMPAGDTQIADLIADAVARGSRVTEGEIAHLNRNVSSDPDILY